MHVVQVLSARDEARRYAGSAEAAARGVQDRENEIARLHNAMAGRSTTGAHAAGSGVRTSLSSISGIGSSDDAYRQHSVEAAGVNQDYAAVAASNARIISQLNEQVSPKFLLLAFIYRRHAANALKSRAEYM